MAYIWKHPNSRFYTAVYRNDQNAWCKKSTKSTARTTAMSIALELERASEMGRQKVLTESICREVLGGILERTTGEKLRQSTVREFCTEWLRGKTHARQEGTAARYGTSITRFLAFLDNKADLPIAAIAPRDCQRFYDYLVEQKLAPATLRVEMKTVSGVFNHARRLGLINTNPVTAVELPERIKQVSRRVFTSAQLQILLDAADAEWKTALLLGFYGGLRLGDAVTLTWDAVSFTGCKLVVPVQKTGETLQIPMHPTLEAHLSKLAGDSTGLLCPALAAQRISGRSGLSRKFIELMKRAGIGKDSADTAGKQTLARLSFHSLRKSFNSALHNKGVEQELRRKLTGHKSDAVNDKYTTTEMATLADAVNKLPSLKP
jgi:integrase